MKEYKIHQYRLGLSTPLCSLRAKHCKNRTMNILLHRITEQDFGDFRNDVKNVLSIAVIDKFGRPRTGNIVEDEEIDEVICTPNAVVYWICADAIKVGGAALHIDNATGKNSLGLFYLYPDFHGKGLGCRAWKTIEQMYPRTKVWEVITPYFEKRNIHFYINKCGFSAVEFFCDLHRDPAAKKLSEPYRKEYFRFEKHMG